MAEKPTSALALSMAGGALTLVVQLLGVNTWFAIYSTNGTSFGYSQWYVIGSLDLTAMQGLAFLVAGAVCGIVIIVGALLQYSGGRTQVRRGSILVLVGAILGAPFTSFGWILGGLLSVLGAALGLGWDPTVEGAAHVFPS